MKFTRSQIIILTVLGLFTCLAVLGVGGFIVASLLPLAAETPAPTLTETPARSAEGLPTWTPTITPSPTATPPPRFTSTPTATPTPHFTATPTQTPTPAPTSTPIPIVIQNPDFDGLQPNRIPGWDWYAFVNYRPGDEYSPENSFAEPYFAAADDAARQINGSTLKIETERWLSFRTWVHQTITVSAGSNLSFQIKAAAYSSLDRLIVNAGIDPTGQNHCRNVQWGNELQINQSDGIVLLASPRVSVPPIPADPATEEDNAEESVDRPPPPNLGRVTICFFAEPTYPHVNNAVFFDQAELIKR